MVAESADITVSFLASLADGGFGDKTMGQDEGRREKVCSAGQDRCRCRERMRERRVGVMRIVELSVCT